MGDGVSNKYQVVLPALDRRDLLSMPTARRRFGEISVVELGSGDSPARTENDQQEARAEGRMQYHNRRLSLLYAHRNSSTAFLWCSGLETSFSPDTRYTFPNRIGKTSVPRHSIRTTDADQLLHRPRVDPAIAIG